jgi:segregation and condensation protein B
MKKRKNRQSSPEPVDSSGSGTPAGAADAPGATDGAGAIDGSAGAEGSGAADTSSATERQEAGNGSFAMQSAAHGATGGSTSDDAEAAPGDDDITSRFQRAVTETVESGSTSDDAEAAPGDDDITSRFQRVVTETVESGSSSDDPLPPAEGSRLESILESLLFAADRPLLLTDLKRLLGDRDGKRINAALERLRERHVDSGVQLVSVAGGWQLRTHPGNGAWVAKLVAGRPPRLSRAMMETLSIVAYRQPITRPEIDEIRGVDCGPVLRTLLDRALIRVIGKKEEVGRPILYGTTPEFLKTFSLRDLTDLPTLREFHELGADDRAKVDATNPEIADPLAGSVGDVPNLSPSLGAGALPDIDSQEEESLIEALDRAESAAGNAIRSTADPTAQRDRAAAASSPEDGER